MNRVATLAALVSSLSLFACAAPGDSSPDSQSQDVEERACQYSGPGNAKYKEAVASAKAWGQEECMALQVETLQLAQEAVALCPAVGTLIAESPYAGELRASLGPLEVAHLAGDLDDGAGVQNPDAVTEALAGQTFWAAGQGAYGPPRIVHLGEGDYELERLVSDDDWMTIERRVTSRGTWALTSLDDGGIEVAFTPEDGAGPDEEVGSFRIERWSAGEEFEMFRLVPADGSLDEYATNALYATNVSECDA